MANSVGEASPERQERGGYLREVWSELRKTVWPTWPELRQMTGVVIVTVVLLGVFLGLLDFGLTAALAPLYTSNTPATATTTPSTSAPAATPTPTGTPSPSAAPSVSPTP
ncbi:MAG: preprotein translocase subunit SecE [Candidatus Dormiibacterota bacterium]